MIICNSQSASRSYAHQLADLLRATARVEPTTYHGVVFVGRDCHAIAECSDAVCASMLGVIPQDGVDAYDKAWTVWRRVRLTLSRAAVIP